MLQISYIIIHGIYNNKILSANALTMLFVKYIISKEITKTSVVND